jgi:hypothetical protein
MRQKWVTRNCDQSHGNDDGDSHPWIPRFNHPISSAAVEQQTQETLCVMLPLASMRDARPEKLLRLDLHDWFLSDFATAAQLPELSEDGAK